MKQCVCALGLGFSVFPEFPGPAVCIADTPGALAAPLSAQLDLVQAAFYWMSVTVSEVFF